MLTKYQRRMLLWLKAGRIRDFDPNRSPWSSLVHAGVVAPDGSVTADGQAAIDDSDARSVTVGARVSRARKLQMSLLEIDTGESVSDQINRGLDAIHCKFKQ